MYSKEFNGQLNAYIRKYLILKNKYKSTKIKLMIFIKKQTKKKTIKMVHPSLSLQNEIVTACDI